MAYSLLGISVVLDLTPNYMGSAPWFENDDEIMEKVKVGGQSLLKKQA